MIRVIQGLILLVLMPGWLQAQSQVKKIRGQVVDAATGDPLNEVLIQTTDPKEGDLTKEDGWFYFETEEDRFMVKHVSYEVQTILLKGVPGQTEFNFTIKLSSTESLLNQVVVTAGKSRQRITETTMSIEHIKPYLIENRNPPSMEQIVDQIPGANITDGQVNIRGGSGWSYGAGSRVMVLVDGLPALSGDAGSVQWSFITMENVKNIEVLKGASSVLFGSAAMNGIINIQTKNPGLEPETEVTQFYGVYDRPKRKTLHWQTNNLLSTGGLRAYHSFRKNSHEWTFNANLLKDDGYRMGDFEKRARVGVQYRWVPENRKIILSLNTAFQTGNSASFLLWQSFDSAYTAFNNSITTTQSTRLNIDPSVTWYSKNLRHQVKSRYFYIDNKIDNGNPANDQSNQSHLVYNEYQNEWKPEGTGFKLTSGIVYSITRSASPLFQGNQTSANTALYSKAEKKWNNLIVNIGGRFEHYALNDYKEKKPVFRSGVNYELAKYSFLRASFGQGYRFPTISEAFISTSVGPLKIFPNPQLQSETGWNAELGFKQGAQYKGIKGFADVALFWTQYQDMMEFTFGQWSKDVSFQNGFGAGFKSLNTGETRIRGVEISTSGEATFNQVQCLFLLGYTYMDSKNLSPLDMIIRDSVGNALTFRSTSSDTNTDDVLKYRPKHLFKADMQFSWKRWEAGYSCRYASYMENIDAAFVSFPLNMFIRDIQKGRELNPNGAFVSDVRMGYKINKSFKINFLVLNLFNKEFMVRPADMQAPRSFSMQLIGKF